MSCQHQSGHCIRKDVLSKDSGIGAVVEATHTLIQELVDALLAVMPGFLLDLLLQLDIVEAHEGGHAHAVDGDDVVLRGGECTSARLMNYSGSSLCRNGRIRSTTLTFSDPSLRGVSGCDYLLI